ncbi:glycosyltransferase [Modicisalibacter radicis]|uniref:glycosyltransferase n=1 Tax=Halomonas sp. EAR18 TaxID=2518972 RepID=UPI001FCE6BB4|nr:glycosyltransferase [Halomonas sp. EAR18]
MERVAVNLADAFAEAGCESHLLTLRHHPVPLVPENAAVHVHHLPIVCWNRATVVGLLIEWVSRLLLNPLLHRSHFVWTGWLGGPLFRLWLKRFEKRHGHVDRLIFRGRGSFEMVWNFRDDRLRFVLENIVRPKPGSWKSRLFARCLYQDNHLVAVSDGVRETLEAGERIWNVSPRSLQTIVNPCPTVSIQRLMNEPDNDIPDSPYIINVARLTKAKDHSLLIRAYARAGIDEKLVIIGEGPERPAIEKLIAELDLEGRVILAGHRLNPYPWLKRARLFVLSSRFEGMGIVLFEALACGTPVLSVDCKGGVRQILKGPLESSLVPREEQALATRIGEMVRGGKTTPDLTCLGEFEPQQVARRFLDAP